MTTSREIMTLWGSQIERNRKTDIGRGTMTDKFGKIDTWSERE